MTIPSEELHFRPPTTFAAWNADGLHIWEERHIEEPMCRLSKSMHRMIVDDALETGLIQVGAPMLIEDIHLCLCAMQSDIWRLSNSGMSSTSCEVNDVLQRDSLRRHLERLNSRLERIIAQPVPVSNLDFGHGDHLPYRYYYGYEDHSETGWQEVVSARVKTILFDTVMLYFLLSLHLSVDVPNLSLIAKDQNLSTIEEISEVHRREREQRQVATKGWASAPAARWALCQAIEVFVAYQNFKNGAGMSANVRSLDPICHVALCVSALIVWAFCKFYDHGCEMCLPGSLQIVELTAWSLAGKQFEKEKEEWIEAGDRPPRFRPQLQGIQLCQCNIEFVVALFQACLPHGWGIADSIAPGIFTNMS
jgi:hypothetical protein